MNLIDNEIEEKKQGNTTIIKIIVASIVILAIIGIVLYVFLNKAKSNQFKFYLNNTRTAYNNGLFIYKNGQSYNYVDDNTTGNDEILISIHEMSNIMSKTGQYEFKQGAYDKFNESVEDCYIETDNETVIFSADTTKVQKLIDEKFEYYTLKSPVKKIQNELYTTIEGIELAFNVKISKKVTEKNKLNIINVETLDALGERYKAKLNNPDFDFSKLSFANKKAIKYGYAVIKNSKNEYGVQKISSNSSNNEIIIGMKYSDIKFIESSQDFIVTTPDKKKGIKSMIASTKDIDTQYVNIELMSNQKELYLVETDDGKKGVYSRTRTSNKNIIYPEYDDIGVNLQIFSNDSIENKYILYENCIPCMKKINNDKSEWYLFDINGNRLTSQTYDSIGYIEGTTSNSKTKNLLLIPQIEGIVVGKNNLYGIIKSTGTQLLPIQVNKIYSESITGEITYYAEYSGNRYNILKLPSVMKNASNSQQNQEQSENKQNDNNTNNNTVDNKNAQSNTTNNNTSNNASSNSEVNNTSKNSTNSNAERNSIGNNTNQ